MNGYIVKDFSKYTSAELTAGVTIPGIFNSIKDAEKPICIRLSVGENVRIAYFNTIIQKNSISLTCYAAPAILFLIDIDNADLVTVTFPD